MTRLEAISSDSSAQNPWPALRLSAAAAAAEEPILSGFLNATVLNHSTLAGALAYHLARKLGDGDLNVLQAQSIFTEAYEARPEIIACAEADMHAVYERDPACRDFLQPFLYYKGFLALQAYRVAHWLWREGRETLALHLQSLISERFAVDIHPAAKVGRAVMIDHATSVVIGETAAVGDGCSLLHEVTLGGTGAKGGDRHPKLGKGVLVGAGAKVLGNIEIGDEARIAAGSVVLSDVPRRCTVAGVPARPVGRCGEKPAERMEHAFRPDGPVDE